MSDEIEGLLKTLYELNERYHNVKERVVWLAGVVYLTFSAALIAWYLRYQSKITPLPTTVEGWHVIVSLSAIFVLTVAFIIRQTREKVHSVVIAGQYMKVIADLPSKTYRDLKKAHKYNFDGTRKPFWDFIDTGWSGHLILGVVGIFFLVQLAVICEVPIPKFLWIAVPAVAIFFPPLVSWIRKHLDP